MEEVTSGRDIEKLEEWVNCASTDIKADGEAYNKY
jgi:hypothetical protein